MIRVAVESPYASKGSGTQVTVPTRTQRDVIEDNLSYLRSCLSDCFVRGEAPFASHGLYTQPGVLDDSDTSERATGIAAGFEWSRTADVRAFYVDRGWTDGMRAAWVDCHAHGQRWDVRALHAETVLLHPPFPTFADYEQQARVQTVPASFPLPAVPAKAAS